jgi:DNA-binding NarL/FixJ family response regulator
MSATRRGSPPGYTGEDRLTLPSNLTVSPSFSVLAGTPTVAHGPREDLRSAGLNVHDNATHKLILDLPRSYAMRTVESMRRDEPKIIVATWNPCPEHAEDLWDQGIGALVSGDVLLRRGIGETVVEIVTHLAKGQRYRMTPGPGTELTPGQRTALRLAVRGLDNGEIAEELCVGRQHVKSTLSTVYQALGVRNHVGAALYYWGIWEYLDRFGN